MELSDALLAAMVRDILKDCPEFQIIGLSRNASDVIEVTVVYTDDCALERMQDLSRALQRLSAFHRQHITQSDEILSGGSNE